MHFPQSHVYACNYFFKLTKTYKLTKLDNMTNSLSEKKLTLYKYTTKIINNIVSLLNIVRIFIVDRGFQLPLFYEDHSLYCLPSF